jgi:hypothetical protein
MYNNDSISKAVITVVASEEEAKNLVGGSDKIKIKIIIDKSKVEEKENVFEKDELLEKETDNDVFFGEENVDTSKTIYSYRKGSDGRIYSKATTEENLPLKSNIIHEPINIYSTANKNIEIYKRYNFKNIHSLDKKDSSRFSLNV